MQQQAKRFVGPTCRSDSPTKYAASVNSALDGRRVLSTSGRARRMNLWCQRWSKVGCCGLSCPIRSVACNSNCPSLVGYSYCAKFSNSVATTKIGFERSIYLGITKSRWERWPKFVTIPPMIILLIYGWRDYCWGIETQIFFQVIIDYSHFPLRFFHFLSHLIS